LRQGSGGRQGARRVLDDVLRDLMTVSQQKHPLALDDLILAPGNAVPVVHLQNAHLPAATHRAIAAPRPAGGEPDPLGRRRCRPWAQLGHN
jgi:hypothetical protein